jgi:hypothetical protein
LAAKSLSTLISFQRSWPSRGDYPSGSHEARVAETRPDQCKFVRRKPRFRKSRPKSIRKWLKVSKRIPGLYQYRATGVYHARVRYGGKLYHESLETKDLVHNIKQTFNAKIT